MAPADGWEDDAISICMANVIKYAKVKNSLPNYNGS